VANHPSSEKRNRQRIKRTIRNRSIKTAFRTLVKTVREAVTKGDKAAAATALAHATSALDSAVTKGVLHRSTASRSVSRLTHAVAGIGASKSA
jgi:small subunit ribosomal protein S20